MGKRAYSDDEDDSLEERYFAKKAHTASTKGTTASSRAALEAAMLEQEAEKSKKKAAKKERQRKQKEEARKEKALEAKATKLANAAANLAAHEKKKAYLEAKKKREEEGEPEEKKTVAEPVDSSKERPMKSLSKGVKYYDKEVGTGPYVQDRKTTRVAYVGRGNTEDGKVFDRSKDFGFRLGKGEVIKGWDIGVKGMREGGCRVLMVPEQAGYGSQNIGAGSGADLWFEITVLPSGGR